MTDRQPITDSDLQAQLRRRSTDDAAPEDAWQRSFVASVDQKLEEPEPVIRSSRAPAFVGLAAGLAVLMGLVLAMPGAIARATPEPSHVDVSSDSP